MRSAQTDEHTSVVDYPDVRHTREALDTARQQYQSVKARLDAIDVLLAPAVSSSTSSTQPPDRIAVLHAEAELPGVRLQLWTREAAVEQAEKAYFEAMAEAKRELEEVRREPRVKLTRRLFEILESAKAVAEEIEAFDLETARLGGRAPLHPYGELLDTPHHPGMVTFRRAYFLREGWL